ncbi:MAG: ROK family protein [Acidobacteria bacterium]|nr:ROK family protein [Acidobacteriota bacterium]MBK9529127.1 ROK family protein [Acidobacteriota bacterium]MBP7475732.1 ROK family protein [Pyrinomonadaceae bacterium]MBP9108975.1 ROK family protein [Pyrinomonadaceae bacterium]
MRKINPKDFKLATRGTSRGINKQIALTLIRTHQPVSRAELARLMETNRANITFLVNELLEEKLVREGAQGNQKIRGRKPTFLYLNSQKSIAVAVDVRASRTFIMITDSIGKQIGEIVNFPTALEPDKFVQSLGHEVRKALSEVAPGAIVDGMGFVIPGMVDHNSGVVLHAPALKWKNVNLLEPLQQEFGAIDIHLENSGKACALSQIWTTHSDGSALNDIVFVSVSDGVGVGVVINGEIMRGKHNTAGEFGHVPLSIDGPPCSCGANGCWEAYISNPATLSRYFGRSMTNRQPQSVDIADFTIEDLIIRARSNDSKALTALHSTARYLGLGLASIINAVDPSRIYIGGELTEAWDIIEPHVRDAIKERALTGDLGRISIGIVPAGEYPRLRGAAALVTAPAFAAPKVA